MSGSRIGPPARLPLTFEVDGHEYTLPELDTRTWLSTLALEPPGCWLQVIPMRLDVDQQIHLLERMFDPLDSFDLLDVETVATNVITEALGLDFWAGHNLATTVWTNWLAFDGWSYTRGVNPLREPIGRVLAACYTWQASQCEKRSDFVRLEHTVWSGPPPTDPLGRPRTTIPTWADDGREEEMFSDFLAMSGQARG